mmetsp:Transcript_89706/g.267587  ORF Transcript_89706/g.267587 Transcript_89706/m.267587 type:complete len:134 (-) Transcript_89706:1998-2399(-)
MSEPTPHPSAAPVLLETRASKQTPRTAALSSERRGAAGAAYLAKPLSSWAIAPSSRARWLALSFNLGASGHGGAGPGGGDVEGRTIVVVGPLELLVLAVLRAVVLVGCEAEVVLPPRAPRGGQRRLKKSLDHV